MLLPLLLLLLPGNCHAHAASCASFHAYVARRILTDCTGQAALPASVLEEEEEAEEGAEDGKDHENVTKRRREKKYVHIEWGDAVLRLC